MLESVYPNIEKANSWETVTEALIKKIVSFNLYFNNQFIGRDMCRIGGFFRCKCRLV